MYASQRSFYATTLWGKRVGVRLLQHSRVDFLPIKPPSLPPLSLQFLLHSSGVVKAPGVGRAKTGKRREEELDVVRVLWVLGSMRGKKS